MVLRKSALAREFVNEFCTGSYLQCTKTSDGAVYLGCRSRVALAFSFSHGLRCRSALDRLACALEHLGWKIPRGASEQLNKSVERSPTGERSTRYVLGMNAR